MTRLYFKSPIYWSHNISIEFFSFLLPVSATELIKSRSLQTKLKPGDKLQSGRTTVKCVKRKPNKSGGGPDKVDLLVLIDLVRDVLHSNISSTSPLQNEHKLMESQVSEYKEVFMLFDKDQVCIFICLQSDGSHKNVQKTKLGDSPSKNFLRVEFNSVIAGRGIVIHGVQHGH